jgi:hypothetical protein
MKNLFGNYPKGSAGHVLNSLVDVGVPLQIVDKVGIGAWIVSYNGEILARFKNFEEIEQTLFCFKDKAYSQQFTTVLNGDVKPCFKLLLNQNDKPALIVTDKLVTQRLVEFIELMLNRVTAIGFDMLFAIVKASSPTVLAKPSPKDYNGDSQSLYLEIQFDNPNGAQAFVDYVNVNFTYVR